MCTKKSYFNLRNYTFHPIPKTRNTLSIQILLTNTNGT